MENNHLRYIMERESCNARTPSPFDVFRNVDSSERPNLFEICAPYHQVSGSAETMALYKPFEAITKNVLVCLDGRESVPAITPNSNIATKNHSCGRRTNSPQGIVEPVSMRATIGVDECNDVTGRNPSS